MKNVVLLLATVATFALLPSCQKNYSGEVGTIKLDTDAELFITNAKINDAAQQAAINNFVIQLKKDSLWNKFGAIYPMVGGTTFSTKWNLKDPRDLDAAYRITWNGSPDFKTTGVTCLTVKDWGDTHFNDQSLMFNNSSLSFYSGTQNQIAGYDMGCSNQIVPFNMLAIYEDMSADIVNTWFDAYDIVSHQPAITVGLFANSSYGGKVVRYDNGIKAVEVGVPQDQHTGKNITIGQVTDDGRLGLKECRLAAIGEGLSDETALKFYSAVKNFEASLSR